jgi:hypothetical protein
MRYKESRGADNRPESQHWVHIKGKPDDGG